MFKLFTFLCFLAGSQAHAKLYFFYSQYELKGNCSAQKPRGAFVTFKTHVAVEGAFVNYVPIDDGAGGCGFYKSLNDCVYKSGLFFLRSEDGPGTEGPPEVTDFRCTEHAPVRR